MRGIKGLFGWRPRKPVELILYAGFTGTVFWTKQADLVYIEVEIQAPGGAGLYDGGTPNVNGGGAGAYARKVIRAADLAAQEAVTIGSPTSFGNWVSCTAGAAGASGVGGAGGIATGGDSNVNGEAGNSTGGAGSAYGGRSVLGYFGGGGMSIAGGTQQPGGLGCVRIREVYVR